MLILYNLGIRLYGIAISIASLFVSKAKLWTKGRKRLTEALLGIPDSAKDNIIWVHCASVGEFEQARPIIERIKKQNPNQFIALTFFSPSGYELRKNYAFADWINYIPLDTQKNAEAFVSTLKPKLAIFIKYEFWYHHYKACKKHGCTIISANSIFRPKQIAFKNTQSVMFKSLHLVDQFFVQDEQSLNLLKSIGITKAVVCPDTRYDRVLEIASQAKSIKVAEQFSKNATVLVAGSTWPIDEKLIASLLQKLNFRLKVILVPHEIDEIHLKSIEKKFEGNSIRFSNWDESAKAQILIVDNMGMLSSLYKYGKYAYVGGGFGKSIHNILEAAVYGIPVFTGPKMQKFKEAIELQAAQGLTVIEDVDSFANKLQFYKENKEAYNQQFLINQAFVASRAGGTEKVLKYLG